MKSARMARQDLVHQRASYQRTVLVGLLALTVLCGLIFIVLNVIDGNYGLAAVELVMSVYAVSLVAVVRRARRIDRWALAYLVPFFSVMMYALSVPTVGMSIFVWVLLIPILGHLLLGRWVGGALAVLYLLCASAIFVSKYGTAAAVSAPYEAIANILLTAVCIFVLSHIHEYSRERSDRALLRLALADPLTGLANRTRFLDSFADSAIEYERTNKAFVLLIIDIDDFKRINDIHGHPAGDHVLISVADLLANRLRSTDVAARIGGEEFGVLLSNCDRWQAGRLAETLRRAVADHVVAYQGRTLRVTVSIGAAVIDVDGSDFKTLFSKADARLYLAKSSGRNRVVVE